MVSCLSFVSYHCRLAVVVLASLSFVSTVLGEKSYVQDYEGYNNQLKYGLNPNITFKSSELVAPLFQVNTWVRSLTDPSPFIFLSPALNQTVPDKAVSPTIVSSEDLSLVWVGQNSSYGDSADNVRVQALHGKNYLTFFTGTSIGGHGNGSCIFLDENYNLVYNITTDGLTSPADVHECQVTSDNTVLVTSYIYLYGYDLTPVGGPTNGTLVDGAFQEIVPETGKAVFTWLARDHFPLNQTYAPYSANSTGSGAGGGFGGSGSVSAGFDWFHINSVEKVLPTSQGNYLVNGRLLRLVAHINGTTGSPIWQLGGKFNSFTDQSNGQATNFAWQHHARFRNANLSQITLFDNHQLSTNANCTSNCSRGMAIDIDSTAYTAKLNQEFYHPQGALSGSMGSIEPLSNGNHFVGWGANPTFTEHSPDGLNGTTVLDVQFKPWRADVGSAGSSYRVFKLDWAGFPLQPPSVAVEGNGTASATVYVSWNGATEARRWALVSGENLS
ncbi:MAG: hypothetical protein Q9160_008891 [Pyrenula sp. 1 TL-2023]